MARVEFGQVDFDVLSGGCSDGGLALEESQSAACGEDGPCRAVSFAVGEGQAFWEFAVVVEAAEHRGVLQGVDDCNWGVAAAQ